MTIREISDGNDDGTRLGQSAADLVSFWGATPGAQPAGNALVAMPRGQAAGVVQTYSSTQSPSAVNTITSSEKAMTVQAGTGFTMQPGFSATAGVSDMFVVNKPTAQAGLGVGNVRVSAANTVQVTMHNPTGGNITPTGSEAYKLLGIRGIPYVTATLSPSSVPADTTMEQQFTITPTSAAPQGLPAGQLLICSKPTAQAGLDIAGCRIVSNNVVGITFVNVSAAPIVPTASEVYSFMALGGLDALNNDICYGFHVGTVGAIGAGTVVSGGATTLTGVLASDVTTGIYKPTPQAAATNVATVQYAILTADTATLYFLGTGSGGTPTANEVYGIRTFRANPAAPLVLYNQTLTPTSVAADTTAEQTFTVTGLVAGSMAWVNKPSFQAGLGVSGVRVSAANTLAITFVNATGSAITPASESYVIGNFQVPAPGANNSVYQSVVPFADRTATLLNGIRSGFATAGLLPSAATA